MMQECQRHQQQQCKQRNQQIMRPKRGYSPTARTVGRKSKRPMNPRVTLTAHDKQHAAHARMRARTDTHTHTHTHTHTRARTHTCAHPTATAGRMSAAMRSVSNVSVGCFEERVSSHKSHSILHPKAFQRVSLRGLGPIPRDRNSGHGPHDLFRPHAMEQSYSS